MMVMAVVFILDTRKAKRPFTCRLAFLSLLGVRSLSDLFGFGFLHSHVEKPLALDDAQLVASPLEGPDAHVIVDALHCVGLSTLGFFQRSLYGSDLVHSFLVGFEQGDLLGLR